MTPPEQPDLRQRVLEALHAVLYDAVTADLRLTSTGLVAIEQTDAVLAVVRDELAARDAENARLRAELEQAREQAADAEFRATDARAVERRNTDLLFDTLYRRWQSTVVEAKRQARRADAAEAELAKVRATTGRRRAAQQAAIDENGRLRLVLVRAHAELASLRALLAHDHAAAYHQGEPRDGLLWHCGRDHCTAPADKPPAQLPTGPGNAEDCPQCRDRRDLPYPFLCPGHPADAAGPRPTTQES